MGGIQGLNHDQGAGTIRSDFHQSVLVMPALQHEVPALLDGVHHLFQNGFAGIFVVDIQGVFEPHREQRSFFLEFEALLVEGPPEPVDDYGNHNGSVLLDDEGRAFSSGRKGLGSTLGEGDDPVVLEGPLDFPGIAGVQRSAYFLSVFPPGTFHRDGSGQGEEPADETALHGFLGRHIFDPGKGPQEVIRQPEALFLPPAYRAENMQEGDDVGEIGLVIADEKHILPGQLLEFVHTAYFKPVDQVDTRIAEGPNQGIHQPLDQGRLFDSGS